MDKENWDPLSSGGHLTCNICVEHTDAGGNLSRKAMYKNATLTLSRNELGFLVLSLHGTKNLGEIFKLEVRQELILHRRFVLDGKGSLQLPDQNIRLMLSNCAPNLLKQFMRIISLKYGRWKATSTTRGRKRMICGTAPALCDISPLNAEDIRIAAGDRIVKPTCNQVDGDISNCKTPVRGGLPVKRCRKNDDNLSVTNDGIGNYSQVARNLNSIVNVGLTDEQKMVLNAVVIGRNVFFTGSAGTGKSFMLKNIIRALPPDATYVTASTGVAASHIGGITLHSFAGIGSGSATLEQCLVKITSRTSLQQWKKCRCLIIDEISMVSGEFFDKLEKIARIVRKCDRPFGGIQLVLCGDFFQLPPVARRDETRSFCFEAETWQRCVDVNFELEKIHRQTDPTFISILRNIRVGRCTDEMNEKLIATAKNVLESGGILATHLCTHNSDASEINSLQLDKLSDKGHIFKAVDSDPTMSDWFDQQCPVDSKLLLKIGTQVMLLKNLDVQRGLVNGARGVVVAFENNEQGLPIVKFISGTKIVVKPERWTCLSSGGTGTQFVRRQVPLKLAWAISIHKAQGMTLDCVEISLSKVFECGQAYVALSRAKNLEGLRLIDFNRRCIRAQPEVLQFYKEMRSSK